MNFPISHAESRGERHRCSSLIGLVSAIIAMALGVSGCGGGGGSASTDGPLRSTMNPVAMEKTYAIDGQVDFSTFAKVNSQAVTINDSGGTAVQATELHWAMDNDDRYLYLALEWQDLTSNNDYDRMVGPIDNDGITVMFDVNGDGTFAEGEDMHSLMAASVGSLYIDQHKVAPGGDTTDLIGDGYGKLSYNGATHTYQAEMLLPMHQDTKGEDGDLVAATRINFVISDHVTLSGGNAGYVFGSTSSSAAWPAISLKNEVGFSHPKVPAGLTGLVAFIGDQDEAAGEVYTMNPATGVVTRVTFVADGRIYKDSVALSHDRTMIAFDGVLCDTLETIDQCKQRTDDYEIFRVNVSGGIPKQLTTNLTRDAHPSWSPDDENKSLVYTSYRNGSNGAVVIMNDDGTETADLSTTSDDRDPSYLPDGRIVFATNRFTGDYQSRIAVMKADGSEVQELTFTSGVSDHQPLGDASQGVFERFPMGLDPAMAAESLFAPWDLVGVPLAGGAENTLLSDGWGNHQPVNDPSGKYVAYLKNTGYNAAQLMGRDGTPYGRFITDITKIRSLDWK